jgi:hypothetical protein
VQFIAGKGGDNPNIAISGPPTRSKTTHAMSASVYELQRYGYFLMDRTKDGWSGTAYSNDDIILGFATSSTAKPHACSPQRRRRSFPTPPRRDPTVRPATSLESRTGRISLIT